MRLKLYSMLMVMGLAFLGCDVSKDASSGASYDQSTPLGTLKLMLTKLELDKLSAVEKLFAGSAKADFDWLNSHKRQVSSDTRGMPLGDLDVLKVEIDGDTAVMTMDKKMVKMLHTGALTFSREGGKWVISKADFDSQ